MSIYKFNKVGIGPDGSTVLHDIRAKELEITTEFELTQCFCSCIPKTDQEFLSYGSELWHSKDCPNYGREIKRPEVKVKIKCYE